MTKTAPDKTFVQTSFGEVAVTLSGPTDAPPVLFVHGIPTSSYLWRHVTGLLADRFRCVAPDLMGLGDTRVDPRTTPLHMDAQAEMLLELMGKLGHERFTLVCHDQGGAAAQVIVARQPERVAAFVITDCVAYDNWPVPSIERFRTMMRLPLIGDLIGRTGLAEWIERATPLSSFRRGVHRKERLSDEAIAEYLRPARGDRDARERFRRFFLAGDSRYTELAVEGLRRFDKPTMVLWAADDAYLSPSWGKKLMEDIPGATRFELIPFCGHFWPEERPSEFASHIGAFLAEHLLVQEDEDEDAVTAEGA